MTDTTSTTAIDLAPGEEADEQGAPPPGFTLAAEASRPDPVTPGIVERDADLEPDEDDVAAAAVDATDGAAEDDDAVDDTDAGTTAPVAEDV
jgi:hypothetical protein